MLLMMTSSSRSSSKYDEQMQLATIKHFFYHNKYKNQHLYYILT